MQKEYEDQTLTYTDDGRLMDEYGYAIMMDWEKPIMEQAAKVICRNGGRVLNVGFGMGLIDTEIEKYDIQEHWIIETHVDVYKKMLEDGWHLKPHVKILYGDWRWYLPYLPKFNGIYIDTWNEELYEFHEYIPNILHPNGVHSYFNNPRNDEKGLHMNDIEYGIFEKVCNIDFEELNLDFIDDIGRQNPNGGFYWNPDWKTYYCPVLTLK
jgi:protein arginine N-methyltransferase 2